MAVAKGIWEEGIVAGCRGSWLLRWFGYGGQGTVDFAAV